MENLIVSLLAFAVEKFPALTSVFLVIGVLRVINKPLFAFLRSYVQATPSTHDDSVLDGIEQSKIYSTISFILDWTASVKLPPKQAPIPELPKGNAPVDPQA